MAYPAPPVDPRASAEPTANRRVALTVLVAALGYFVDIYDLILFAVVRKASLIELGVAPAQLESTGGGLMALQMAGMLVGGVIWGVMGDRLGRKRTLFGSILVYSLANLLNAFVSSVPQYQLLRFVAGLGLAGELGAAVTLVSESMRAEQRGYGTTLVAGVGVCGALLAAWVGKNFSWQTAYIVGGLLGLALLGLRFGTFESGLFEAGKAGPALRGDLRMLLRPWSRLRRYLTVILTGVPIWFSVGILVVFASEFAKELHVSGEISGGQAVFWAYLGLGVGDLAAGLVSQALRSRRRALVLFLLLDAAAMTAYLNAHGVSVGAFEGLLFAIGLANGYWAVFATTAAEQFGTNLRATVATTAPNVVRGSLVLIEPAYKLLREGHGRLGAAAMIGAVCLLLALLAAWQLDESFGKDLDFTET